MAELNVQPKKKTNYLPWILLLLGLIALIWFLTRDKGDKVVTGDTTRDTTALVNATTSTETPTADWNAVDMNAPAVTYEEVTDKNINVRGAGDYAIYGVGEDILFDEGKATLRSEAEKNLKEVAASIGKRYNAGNVRVYGFTDSQGSAGANKELAQQRADAVKSWLQNNGIGASRISVNAIGEAQPQATNSTEEGRKQNRRVEIVARGTGK